MYETRPCLATELSAAPDSACMLQKRMEDVGQEEQEHMSDGLALSNSIMELAESLEEGETKEFLRSFRICGSCKEFKRFGEARGRDLILSYESKHGL